MMIGTDNLSIQLEAQKLLLLQTMVETFRNELNRVAQLTMLQKLLTTSSSKMPHDDWRMTGQLNHTVLEKTPNPSHVPFNIAKLKMELLENLQQPCEGMAPKMPALYKGKSSPKTTLQSSPRVSQLENTIDSVWDQYNEAEYRIKVEDHCKIRVSSARDVPKVDRKKYLGFKPHCKAQDAEDEDIRKNFVAKPLKLVEKSRRVTLIQNLREYQTSHEGNKRESSHGFSLKKALEKLLTEKPKEVSDVQLKKKASNEVPAEKMMEIVEKPVDILVKQEAI